MSDKHSLLGPADGAYFRSLYPTPKPGEVVPYPNDGVTLESLDQAWYDANEAAHARIRENRLAREQQATGDRIDPSADKK
jgi:hypothetical protein